MGQLQQSPTRRPDRRRLADNAPPPPRQVPADRFRYGGPWFLEASALPLHGGLGRPERLARLLAAGVRRPRQVLALAQLLLHTRSEEVLLSESSTGRRVRRYFDQKFLGIFPQNRLCQAVLILPPCHADYLRGRRRQALRTNLRRAAAAGIQCEQIAEASEALNATREILDRRVTQRAEAEPAAVMRVWRSIFARPHMSVAVARDKQGRPLALIAAIIDERLCVIHGGVACERDARWALHDHLVRLLIARGVRHVLADGGGPFGALGFTPEVHYYQRLLGYELRHLVPQTVHLATAACGNRSRNPLTRYLLSSVSLRRRQ
jgi:hypothetical protein